MLEKCISIFWVHLLPKGCFSSMHETFSSNDVDLVCLSYNKDIYIYVYVYVSDFYFVKLIWIT